MKTKSTKTHLNSLDEKSDLSSKTNISLAQAQQTHPIHHAPGQICVLRQLCRHQSQGREF